MPTENLRLSDDTETQENRQAEQNLEIHGSTLGLAACVDWIGVADPCRPYDGRGLRCVACRRVELVQKLDWFWRGTC